MNIDTDSNTNQNASIVIDRGLAQTGIKVHGINPALLVEKILRERIQDSYYWHTIASTLTFYELLDECVKNVHIIGTYLKQSKTEVCKFIILIFRLLQFNPQLITFDIVKWLIVGDHGFKYLTVLFMLYARIVWEDPVDVWNVLESKLNDFRKIRLIDNDGTVKLYHIDEIANMLLQNDKFIDMALPRLVNRWVLEEKSGLEERESELMDEFELEVEQDEEENDSNDDK